MLILESSTQDVYRNLAIEEYLMDHVTDLGPILFLWQSDCAVVLGKNQNPWQECRLDLMENERVPMARRVSGGGTVYHDAGNLNYCVITTRESYREEQAYSLVFQALETFGITAEKTGKSNLSVDGLKFSGNAFAFRKGRAMHHGTLLLQTDLKRLNRYLGSMVEGIETHAIASVPAHVTNLNLDKSALSNALKERFLVEYQDGNPVLWSEENMDESVLQRLHIRQISDDWKFGGTPRFSLKAGAERVEISKGIVENGQFKGQEFKNIAFSLFC
jgi:lipoate-protein ligase A